MNLNTQYDLNVDTTSVSILKMKWALYSS